MLTQQRKTTLVVLSGEQSTHKINDIVDFAVQQPDKYLLLYKRLAPKTWWSKCFPERPHKIKNVGVIEIFWYSGDLYKHYENLLEGLKKYEKAIILIYGYGNLEPKAGFCDMEIREQLSRYLTTWPDEKLLVISYPSILPHNSQIAIQRFLQT